MIKVVLVDDETLVKVGLKSLASWENLGFEIVAEGYNGEEGLDLVKQYRPNLVITDIVMPKMDGIELIRQIKAFDASIQVIVLSSYDEFDLVRKAMKYGAWDYILKLNICQEALDDVLEKVKEVINSNGKEKDDIPADLYDAQGMSAIQQDFLKSVVSNMIPDRGYIDNKLAGLNLRLNEKKLQLGLIETNLNSVKSKYCEDQDVKLLDFVILEIITEIGNEFFNSYFLKWSYGVYVMVFSIDADEAEPESDINDRIKSMCGTMIEMIKKYVNLGASIGISNTCTHYQMLSGAFAQARKAISGLFYMGYGNTLFYDDFKAMDLLFDNQLNFDLDQELSKAFTIIDIVAVKRVFEHVLHSIDDKKLDKNTIYDLCNQFSYLSDFHLGEKWQHFKNTYKDGFLKIDAVYAMKTVSDIYEWLCDFCHSLIGFMNNYNRDHKHIIITKAQKYILDNCHRTFTLTDVADNLSISSSYLSGLFPKYTGMSFTEYVNKVKIKEAQQLIHQGQYKIYEISYMLGYDNACYFSKIFKKLTGCTPTEFQQSTLI